MNLFSKLFRSRDKPQNHLGGLSFLFGQTAAAITNMPGVSFDKDKQGRASDSYRAAMLKVLRTNFRQVENRTRWANPTGCSVIPSALAFGDYAYYNIGDRGTRSLQELKELFAGNGMVAYLMKERVDGKLVLAEAVQLLKIKG